MNTFRIIIHTIFITSAIFNCYISKKNKNFSAVYGWLSAIIIDIPNILTLILNEL